MSSFIRDCNETRQNLVKEISNLKYDRFNARPNKTKWSIAQVCHHLVLVELATTKVIHWGLQEKENAVGERKNVHLLLDRTKKIQAPKMVEPSEEPFEVQQMIERLSETRQKLLKTIASLEDPSLLQKKSVNHPALGALPLDQWVELIPLHEQRHMEQIKEIKSYFHFT